MTITYINRCSCSSNLLDCHSFYHQFPCVYLTLHSLNRQVLYSTGLTYLFIHLFDSSIRVGIWLFCFFTFLLIQYFTWAHYWHFMLPIHSQQLEKTIFNRLSFEGESNFHDPLIMTRNEFRTRCTWLRWKPEFGTRSSEMIRSSILISADSPWTNSLAPVSTRPHWLYASHR